MAPPRRWCVGRASARTEGPMEFDIYTIIFLVLAVFIFFRLRSVLGQRTGHERPPAEPIRRETPPAPGSDKVIPLPPRAAEQNGAPPAPDALRWSGYAAEGSEVAAGLDAVAAADRSFDAKTFSAGAKAA